MNRRGVYQLELAAASALLGGVVLVSLLAVTGVSRSSNKDWQKPPQRNDGAFKESTTAERNEVHYIGLGVGGCATASCHGGVRPLDAEGKPTACTEWKNSAFVFLQQDPHAQAFNVLFEERSREIVNRLATGDRPAANDPQHIDWYVGQLQEKCVSCHATPLPEDVEVTPQAGLNHYALGVTCEACHGPASRWVDEHLDKSWTTSCTPGTATSGPYKRGTGFNELEDLSVAAATCTKCHVGSGEEVDGKSRRTVSHDLMAAGHPRLDFEFSAWYASMPPHWNRDREQRPGFHTDAWRHGQTGVWQAKAASVENFPITSSGAIQPDLAQFDCLACHHALRSPSGYVADTGYVVPKTALTFGSSWKFFAPLHGDEVAAFNEQLANYYAGQPAKLHATDLAIHTDPAELSGKLAKELTPQSWDQFVAWYYAAEAAQRDAAFAAKVATDLQPASELLDERLQALKAKLEAYVTSSGEISRYFSPRGFDLQAMQPVLIEAQSALREVAQQWPQKN